MHRLRSVLRRQPVLSATPDLTVREVALTMTQNRVGAIPVLAGGRLVGIFSERDLMTRVVVPERDPATTLVSEVMTRDVVTASPNEPVDRCVEKMKRVGCRHLPVVSDGAVIGMVSMRDLLRDELEEQDQEIRSLKAYLHQEPL